jgi:hypothetical protein
VVCHAQLIELGMSSDGVKRRVRNERLVALHRGVYAVGHTGLTLRGHELAAVFVCGPKAVLSHRSAGRLWGLLRSGSSRIEVTAPRSREWHAVLTVHTTRCLSAEDRDVMDAIPITSLARTIVDLAETLTDPWLARAVHEAEVRTPLRFRARGPRGDTQVSRPMPKVRPPQSASPAHRGLPRRLLLAPGAACRRGRRRRVSPHPAGLSRRSSARPRVGGWVQVLQVTWRDLDRGQQIAGELQRALAARTG